MKSSKNEWSGKSRGGSFGYKFFIFMIRQFGVRAAYAFLSLVVKYNRRILKYNPVKSVFKLYQHYYLFGQTIIDKIAITNGLNTQFKFEFENYDQFLEQLNQGASIMIGAHVGCWEIGSAFFGDYASKLNVVMHDNEYQKIKELVKSSKSSYKIIAINEGSIESLLKIKQAIDKGEYVCFQGDRYIDKNTTCPVQFMGKDALFPIGPSLIASKFKVPVIFYFAMREKGMRYRFIFHTVEPGLSQKEILNLYVSEFEKVVKRYPQQWFNFYDVWQQK